MLKSLPKLCAFSFAISLVAMSGRVTAQTMGDDRMKVLYEANDLDIDGRIPFRLHMTFQLYDLSGKATEQGTVEMYGAPGGSKHLVVHAPSLNENGTSFQEDAPAGAREAYLVSELIGVALNPVPKPGPASPAAQQVSRQFGKVALECVSPHSVASANAQGSDALFCTEATKDAVRYVVRPGGLETITRNAMGVFHGTQVSLNVEIDFGGRPAISAKVTTLESVDPSTLEPPQPTDPGKAGADASGNGTVGRARISGGLIQGTRTKFVAPDYPLVAKSARMSGSVLIYAVIAKDGSVKHLVPIASNDPVFTEAAVAAVKKWMYRPYVLNGEPTEVDTTITVNFALR